MTGWRKGLFVAFLVIVALGILWSFPGGRRAIEFTYKAACNGFSCLFGMLEGKLPDEAPPAEEQKASKEKDFGEKQGEKKKDPTRPTVQVTALRPDLIGDYSLWVTLGWLPSTLDILEKSSAKGLAFELYQRADVNGPAWADLCRGYEQARSDALSEGFSSYRARTIPRFSSSKKLEKGDIEEIIQRTFFKFQNNATLGSLDRGNFEDLLKEWKRWIK